MGYEMLTVVFISLSALLQLYFLHLYTATLLSETEFHSFPVSSSKDLFSGFL